MGKWLIYFRIMQLHLQHLISNKTCTFALGTLLPRNKTSRQYHNSFIVSFEFEAKGKWDKLVRLMGYMMKYHIKYSRIDII